MPITFLGKGSGSEARGGETLATEASRSSLASAISFAASIVCMIVRCVGYKKDDER